MVGTMCSVANALDGASKGSFVTFIRTPSQYTVLLIRASTPVYPSLYLLPTTYSDHII